MPDNKERLTFGELWEKNQHMNIFCPDELKMEDVGRQTVNIPQGRDEVVVQEIEVHEDGNWSIISEKIVRTATSEG